MAAWLQGTISRDTLLHNLRAGESLPPARTNEQEVELIGKEPTLLSGHEILSQLGRYRSSQAGGYALA